jgi:predicted nucleic acid-binding protein
MTIAPMSAEAPAGAVYLDSSAIVKLVIREPESDALLAFLEPRQIRVTSALARVEAVRAVRRHGRQATTRAHELLDGLNLLALDDALLDSAAAIDANELRSLDAIHIASAQQLQAELDALVSYDERMLTAARALGVPVSHPT